MDKNVTLWDHSPDQVKALLEKSKQEQLRRRNTPTDTKLVSYRPGKGGKEFKYIEGMTAQRWLDENFPLWNFKITDKWKDDDFYYVSGVLKVYNEDGIVREVEDIGCDEEEFNNKTGAKLNLMYWKSAKTDCVKRCCVNLGGFTDIYSDEALNIKMLSNEEIEWYVKEALPKLMAMMPANVLFKNMTLFASGLITKEEITEIYN